MPSMSRPPAPEETIRVPVGHVAVPVVSTVPLTHTFVVMYWMGTVAGTSADAGEAEVANPPTMAPAAKAVDATAMRRIFMGGVPLSDGRPGSDADGVVLMAVGGAVVAATRLRRESCKFIPLLRWGLLALAEAVG